MKLNRGDIVIANLESVSKGSIQKYTRPYIIISNNKANQYSPVVTAVAMSTKTWKKKYLPTHCADYAQFCGGTPQQNRPVDPDCTGICGKSSIGKISRNGFRIYHRYGDHCDHTIAVNVLRNDPIR